jgi:chromosome segregation ATPase
MKRGHFQEISGWTETDKTAADKDEKDRAFNENAGKIIGEYNRINAEKKRFETKLAEKQAELEAAQGAEEQDERKLFVLGEYVEVYQQQINSLNDQIGLAQEKFELVSEEKRLRDEQEKAVAAEKAKENEFNDMKAALDEAKEF